jgi:hypothetical protein
MRKMQRIEARLKDPARRAAGGIDGVRVAVDIREDRSWR